MLFNAYQYKERAKIVATHSRELDNKNTFVKFEISKIAIGYL